MSPTKKYRVVLSRDLLVMGKDGASGVVQAEVMEAVLSIIDVSARLRADYEPSSWRIVKMDEIQEEKLKPPALPPDPPDLPIDIIKEGSDKPTKYVQGTLGLQSVKFGGHDYQSTKDMRDAFTSDCAYGCGCWCGPTRSGGPKGIDPMGECPKNPIKEGSDGPFKYVHGPTEIVSKEDLIRGARYGSYEMLFNDGPAQTSHEPPDWRDGGFPYQDIELEDLEGVPMPKGRFVLRRTPDDNRIWDRETGKWVTTSTGDPDFRKFALEVLGRQI